ncbi:hypothetical protein [Desulfofundulus sp.]|uniref:hypothetical protein n=1 Tax=Desulfofundulus sp. TaxID=2282750 RepID=UPI003C76A261
MPSRDWQADWDFLCHLKETYQYCGDSDVPIVYIPWVIDFGEYWLQRVRELETQCAAMRETLQGLAYSDGHFRGECTVFRCHPVCEKARKALSGNAGRELLERIKKLEAVVEAARGVVDVISVWPSIFKYHPKTVKLNEALAALDKKEG